MEIYVAEKPLMSDAQFAALAAVDHRAGAVDVVRLLDCGLNTLRSMAGELGRRRHAPWITLTRQDGKVVGGRLTTTGINAYDAERARRARKATFEARLAVHTRPRSITTQADPFALVGAGSDTIPF